MAPTHKRPQNDNDDAGSSSDMQMESSEEEEVEEVEEEGEDEADAEGEEEEEDDDEDDEQVDIEGDDEDVEVEEDVDVEEEDEDDDDEDDDVPLEITPKKKPPPPQPMQPHPRLKITLKMPANNGGSSAGTATPDDPEQYLKRTPRRRAKAKVINDADIESEDPSSPPSDSESDEGAQVAAVTGTSRSAKSMTTRQAVLASVVDPTHVSLDEGSRSKKRQLNDAELALRREETARKRKNLSEKKLEDEKAETINRLLKKQSRPKNKRQNTMDDRSPMPGVRTPNVAKRAKDADGDADMDMDVDVEQSTGDMDADAGSAVEVQRKPTMFRWVSREDGITFSVPETALPPPQTQPLETKGRGPGVCAVDGCGRPRKYRLPRDWTIGACDSVHLRAL